VARRAAFVDSLRARGVPLVLVDGGNFFARDSRETDIVSVVSWKEMERLGYDAATLGRAELENWALVKMMIAEGTLPLVTTNLEVLRDSTWRSVGATQRIIERGGLRLGILGLMGDRELPEWVLRSAKDSLRVRPMLAAARQAADPLAKDVDLVIALLAGDRADARALADSVPELDLIVGGIDPADLSCPDTTMSAVIINRSGPWGRTVGVTRIGVSRDGDIVERACDRIELTNAFAEDPSLVRDVKRVMDISRELLEQAEQGRALRGWGRRQ
jgi:2',3'-cyclic-nucleotide 2'-phosphodiesterase (5'-nucleotidase family)